MTISMQTKVFLSGAIEDIGSYKNQWREQASELLFNAGFKAVNPMDYALEEEDCDPKEIVAKNTFLQKKCDLILVEYTIPNRAYIGTDYEMTWAHLNNQPIIVWASPQISHRIYLKYLATKLVYRLEDAVEYISHTYPSKK